MKQLLPILALINCLLFQPYLQAQNITLSDEQLIRNIIERANNGEQSIKFTDSIIRVFPDLPYPQVGRQRTEEEMKLWDSIRKERSNEKLIRNPLRIVISSAKDLAYVYGNYTVDYDNSNSQHVHNDGSFLLVLRKVKNEWLVESIFNRYDKKSKPEL